MDNKFKIVVAVLVLMNAIFLGVIMFRQDPGSTGPDLTKIEDEIKNMYTKVDSMDVSVKDNNALISDIGTIVISVDNHLAEITEAKKTRKKEFTSDIETLQGLSLDSLKAVALKQ